MVAEYYYNPNTNKTFTKDSAQKVAVPEGFNSVTEDVYQSYVTQGVQPAGVFQAVTGLNTDAMDANFTPPPMQPQPPASQGTQDPSQFIQGQVGSQVRQPGLPTGTSVGQQLQLQNVSPGTIQTTPGVLTGDAPAGVPAPTVAPTITPATVGTAAPVSPIQFQETFRTYTPTDIGTAAQTTAEQTAVNQNELVQAQQAELTANATVRGQLANITSDVENALAQGNPLPPFARGAQRVAEAAMAKRGLGASSIAAEAIAEGVLRAGTQIAAADAEAYRQIILANLNNRQQAAIQNAQTYFQTDMTNLSNRQATSLTNLQNRQQVLLSDQAADNASLQFNATSQKQTDEFFDNLQAQIQTPVSYTHLTLPTNREV